MRIERFHIDGFGRFHDAAIGPLERPVTVFFGPNEAGKSTVLEFIRAVLFGFPRTRKDRHYPPLQGGRHGGRVAILDEQGQRLVVERFAGRGLGPVQITDGAGQVVPEERLAQALGGQGKTVFSNLFAFTLDELHSDDLLKDESVNRQIYSAGVGERNLPAALTMLDKQKKDIYSRLGRSHRLVRLRGEIAALDKGLAASANQARRFGQLAGELRALDQARSRLDARANELAARQRRWQNLDQAWEDFANYRETGRELAQLESINALPEEPPDSHDLAILALQRQRSAFDGSIRDLPQRQSELAAHKEACDRALAELGPGWDRARVARFAINRDQLGQAASLAERIEHASAQLATQRAIYRQLAGFTEKTIGEPAKNRWPVPASIALAGGLLGAAVFLSIALYPGAISPGPAAGLAGSLLLALVAATWMVRWSARRRSLGRLRDRVEQAAAAHRGAVAAGHAWSRANGLDESVSPQSAKQLRALAERARTELANVNSWRRRVRAIERDIAVFADQVISLAKRFDIPPNRDDPQDLARVADELIDLADRARTQRSRNRDQHQTLTEHRRRLGQRLQRRIGPDQDLDRLLANLDATGPAEIEREFTSSAAAARTVADELAENAVARRVRAAEMEQLDRENESDRLVQERSLLDSQFQDAAREWVVLTLAERLLAQARARYEQERQPGIIRAAQAVFADLTDGRYPQVVAPLGSESIAVVNDRGSRREPAQLSRGTREQLFLALRFGLIEELSRRAQPLPVAVDEILVNFDSARAASAARALTRLSAGNQLLCFTCHDQVVEHFSRAADELGVPGPAVIELANFP